MARGPERIEGSIGTTTGRLRVVGGVLSRSFFNEATGATRLRCLAYTLHGSKKRPDIDRKK